VKNALHHLGYSGDRLQENYIFDDASAIHTKELCIPLGAFAQWPPNYRTACIGVLQANGDSGPLFVASHRALGAPMFFEVYDSHVVRYRMESGGQAIALESIPVQHIAQAFERNREKWNPEAIFRAKSISPISVPVQLDFIDAGLLPALKGMIHEKLDRLLRKTLYQTIISYQKANSGVRPDDIALFRLVFRLLAAKIFKDKMHSEQWLSPDPHVIINDVQKIYGSDQIATDWIINEPSTMQVAWDHLRNAFNFQNLSEEDLAFIYENTLVSNENRKVHGVHATPSIVAELMVDHLPFEDLPRDERFVLEPCAGHGVFLVAALRRLRELLPASWSSKERHTYLKERLQAIEHDPFASEVCRLSLTLADFPNPDGWNIVQSDIFGSDVLEQSLLNTRIVLCNPPFEDFKEEERVRYKGQIQSVHKPYEVLRRILQKPPTMFGIVLPKSAIMGGRYNELQDSIAQRYLQVETIALPDRIFSFSDQETMLFLVSKPDVGQNASIHTKTYWIRETERESFLKFGCLPETSGQRIPKAEFRKTRKKLWNPPLWELLDYLQEFSSLREIADIHRGIEWNCPVATHSDFLISAEPKPGFQKGIDRVRDKLEPYWLKNLVYLNMDEKFRRTAAHALPWDKPKVIINGNALMRSPWRIMGYPDKSGLVCFQNFMGIWTQPGISVECLAAIINSPVANFISHVNEGKRRNRISTIEKIPIPSMARLEMKRVAELVIEYQNIRRQVQAKTVHNAASEKCIKTLLMIDSLILKAYDLPPRIERKLLDFFNDYPRPVPVPFPNYFPADFKPCLPLYHYLSMDSQQASMGELLTHIAPVDSESIHNFVLELEKGSELI
jgi:hypothetical protein